MPRDPDFDYQRYLASREWALLKKAVRKRSRGQCERCGLSPMKATHHLTYERVGNEELGDLQGVCKDCHDFLSAVSDRDPALVPVAADASDPSLAEALRMNHPRERMEACHRALVELSHRLGYYRMTEVADRIHAARAAELGHPLPLDDPYLSLVIARLLMVKSAPVAGAVAGVG